MPSADAVRRAFKQAEDSARANRLAGMRVFAEVVERNTAAASAGPLSIDESAILWGLTDFIVQRVKENLNEYGLKRFIKARCGEQRRYLASTCDLLQSKTDDEAFLPSLSALRQAVRADLEQLPKPVLAERARPGTLSGSDRDLVLSAYMTGHIFYGLKDGNRLLGALGVPYDSVSTDSFTVSCRDTPIAAGVFRFSAIAAELAAGQPLKEKQADRLIQYESAVKALMIRLHDAKTHGWPTDGAGAHCGTHERAGSGFSNLPQVFGVLRTLEAAIATLQQAKQGVETARARGDAAVGDARRLYALNLVDALSDVVRGLIGIVQTERSREASDVVARMREITRSLIQGDYGTALVSTVSMARAFAPSDTGEQRRISTVLSYVGFAADLAAATDAATVTQALNRVAAPRSAFLRKRRDDRGHGYLTLNAYAGAGGATETVLVGSGLSGEQKRSFAFSAFVPVGPELGISLGKGWSVGALLAVIDLGALTSFRTQSDTSIGQAPEVKFQEVFAPSVNVVVGIPGFLPRSASTAMAMLLAFAG